MRIKSISLRWIAAFVGATAPLSAFAVNLSLDNLNLGDYESLVKEFSANSQYSSVTPASSLGGLGGFEFGLVGGLTRAPDTDALVKRSSPTSTFKGDVYHAGALLRIGIPYGFTAEGLYIPKTTISAVKLGRWALAVQWTLTDAIIEDLPVHLALKGYYTKTTLDYSQTIQNSSTANVPVNADIGFDNNLWGVQALVSYKLFVLEPWLGVGYTKAKGVLNVNASGSTTIFNQTVFGSAAKSAESKPSSWQLLLGSDLRLAFFSLGAEYERAFSRNSYTGRLSFRF